MSHGSDRRVLHVVGLPASGKTYLCVLLSEYLEWPSYSIDEERLALLAPGEQWLRDDSAAWENLRQRVTDRCIVETAGVAPKRDLFADAQVVTVLCRADESIRRRRLEQRVVSGYSLVGGKRYVERLMGSMEPESFDLVWAGGSIETLVDALPW